MTRLKYRSARANSAAAVLRWSGSLATDPDAFAMDVSGMLLAFFRRARGATAGRCKRVGQGAKALHGSCPDHDTEARENAGHIAQELVCLVF